ncbi:MAG: alpha/beta hydrolase [Chitinophagaceae bacterium]|nr:MAG: alpha/beta hydrolase [Chitinophagaceae bacterium]
MRYIIECIEEALGCSISDSMFNKDLQQMRQIYNAPLEYNREHRGYCYTQNGFSIKEFPLTNEEIEALDFSTALLQQLKGTRMFNHATLEGGEAYYNMLDHITQPTLIIHGTEDKIWHYKNAELLLDGIQNSHLTKLEGTGHELHPQDFDTITKAIARQVLEVSN